MIKIAIVGEPNVGKSSLFNVLIGRRYALTGDEAGITRDFLSFDYTTLSGQKIQLLDTAGIIREFLKEDIASRTNSVTFQALDSVDGIFLLVDKTIGVSKELQSLIHRLKLIKKEIILVLNKIDKNTDYTLNDFRKLGLGEGIEISCTHRIGIDVLEEKIDSFVQKVSSSQKKNSPAAHSEALLAKDFTDLDDFDESTTSAEEEEDEGVQVLVLGRPNVGKSTFFNKVLGKDRAIVSSIAGTTRDILIESVVYKGQKITFYDTAGLRKRRNIVDSLEKEMNKKVLWAMRQSHMVLLILSAEEGITQQDNHLVELIQKEKKPCLVLMNKWDMIPEDLRKYQKEKILDVDFHLMAPIFFDSLLEPSKNMMSKILEQVQQMYRRIQVHIPTKTLTEFLRDLTTRKATSKDGKVFKVFFATYISEKFTIQISVNDAKLCSRGYQHFLVTQVMEHFHLEGLPLEVKFISKEKRSQSKLGWSKR